MKTKLLYLYLRYLKRIDTPAKLIAFACKHFPHRNFIYENKALNLKELYAKAQKLAHNLYELGLQKGDSVGIQSSNKLEFIILRLACYQAGYVFCAFLEEFDNKHLEEAIIETRSKLVFLPKTIDSLKQTCPDLEFQMEISSIDAWSQGPVFHKRKVNTNPNEVSAIAYTSGSTGKSKAVVWSHKAWLYSFYHFLLNSTESGIKNPVYLHAMPFSSSGSLSLLPALMHGSRHIIQKRFDAEVCLQNIERHKVSHIYLAPGFLYQLWDTHKRLMPKPSISSLQEISVGSAPLASAKWKMLSEYFNCPIKQGYGMSEVLAPISFISTAQLETNSEHWYSVGKLVPQVKLKLNNKSCICLKSNTACLGYLRKGKIDRSSFCNSYFISSDIGKLDGEQFLFLHDREQNCFQLNNIQFSSKCIEEYIYGFMDIKDVKFLWHNNTGFVFYSLCANYNFDVSELKTYIFHKYPILTGHMEFIELKKFPYTSSGKLQRHKLEVLAGKMQVELY